MGAVDDNRGDGSAESVRICCCGLSIGAVDADAEAEAADARRCVLALWYAGAEAGEPYRLC